MKLFLTIFMALAVLTTSAPTRAQLPESSEQSKQRASEFFDRGMILFESGRYSRAAEAFLLAYEAYSHPSTLINIALCYEKAGWVAKAYTYYRLYLTEVNDAPDSEQIKGRLRELMDSVGEIIVSCAFEPCMIRVDGSDYGKAPITVVVEPGMHLVEGVKDGRVVASLTVRIDAAGFEELSLSESATAPAVADPSAASQNTTGGELEPDLDSSVDENPQSAQRSNRMPVRAPFWVLAAGTLAAGVSTAIVGGMTVGVQSDFEESGKTDQALADRGSNLQLTTNILFGVTGALAVGAIVALTLDLKRAPERQPLAFSVSPGGISMEYSF